MLSAKSVLTVLSSPEQYHFAAGVWFAINRPDGLDAIDDRYTIHERLGLTREELDARLTELGLHGRPESTWQQKLAGPSSGSAIHMEFATFGTRKVRFIAFRSLPSLAIKEQMEKRGHTKAAADQRYPYRSCQATGCRPCIFS